MSNQSISNLFNSYAAKEVYNNPVRGTDSNTAKAISDAHLSSYGKGYFVGLNGIAYNQKNEGIVNRHATNYKEIKFVQQHGFYPEPTQEWIA